MSDERQVTIEERLAEAERERDEALAREAELRRTLDERAIAEGTRLLNEKLERDRFVAAENAQAQARHELPRPRTWSDWCALTDGEKARAIGLYPGCQDEVHADRRRRDAEAKHDEISRKLANVKPLFNR